MQKIEHSEFTLSVIKQNRGMLRSTCYIIMRPLSLSVLFSVTGICIYFLHLRQISLFVVRCMWADVSILEIIFLKKGKETL